MVLTQCQLMQWLPHATQMSVILYAFLNKSELPVSNTRFRILSKRGSLTLVNFERNQYMKSKLIIIVLTLLLCLFLQGCNSLVPNGDSKSSSITTDNQKTIKEIKEIPFYDKLNLAEYEQVSILDASSNLVLINIFEDYKQGNSNYREVGFNSFSHRVEIFNLNSKTISESHEILDGEYCTNGIFTNDGFAYVTIKPKKESLSTCNLVIRNKNGLTVTLLGDYSSGGYSEPQLAALDGGRIAYSYYDQKTCEFGVKTINPDGLIKTQLTLKEDGKTEFLMNTLGGNHNKFLFYCAVNSEGTFYIGDENGISNSFALAENERIYDYCLLRDSCLMSIETIGSDGNSQKDTVLRDYSGRTVSKLENTIFFRTVSNNDSIVLSIDNNYQPYLIKADRTGIYYEKISIRAAPVLFYAIDAAHYLAHYNYSFNGSKLGLFEITIY